MTLMRCVAVWATMVLLLCVRPAVAQEKIQFPSLDRDASGQPVMLDGYLFKPDSASTTERYPAVVFMHGCGGLLTHSGHILSREQDWAERLSARGYVVLAVDSFTTRGQQSECAHGGAVTPEVQRPRDAYGALRFLQSRSDVQAQRVALMGWSHGGGTVLFTIGPNSPAHDDVSDAAVAPAASVGASADAGVGAAVATAPADFRAAIAFYPGWCNARAQQPSSWHTTIPLLILVGASDVWTPAQPCEDFVQTVRANHVPVDIHVYPDAYHDFDFPNLPVRSRFEFANRRTGVVPITGTNPAARADAIERATAYLAQYLKN